MAGITFRVQGTLTIGAISTAKCLCLLVPNNSRRLLIKEFSVTVTDPSGNGGFVNVRLSSFTNVGTGMSSGTIRKDDPNISETIGASLYDQSGGAPSVEPSEEYAFERKNISVNGGEALWIAIREEDKHPISGGNSSGTGKQRVGLIAETDGISNGVKVDYTLRGEY